MSTDTVKPLILCVDDEAEMLRFLKESLTRRGFDVLTAASGAQAMDTLRQAKPDCILLDIMMPVMDGYTLCGQLQRQEETATIPVIFVSGLDSAPAKSLAFSLGGVDYVVKPCDLQALLDQVQASLKTRTGWQDLQQHADLGAKRSNTASFWELRVLRVEHERRLLDQQP